jgi:hypothetical protein
MAMLLRIHISTRAEVVLARIAKERGCEVEDLAAAAVEDEAIRAETDEDREGSKRHV